ncbi:BRO-N domain-containing protein [Pseudomonas guineae]|uniref:BRO-N domain-containing protein n=1 Tax=Pseudomonas guineae TaxID=425504 RepID=UPI003D0703A7
MGIELDVLVGHPEHELLFVANQVARAAGLKNPSTAVQNFHSQPIGHKLQVGSLPSLTNIGRDGRTTPSNTWLFDEARVYVMLMRGSTGKAEDFQRWIATEVLPTIRKTGKYNAEESSNPAVLRT